MNFEDLMKTDDYEFIKECIEKRGELGLSPYKVYCLIEKINDPEYTKECIERGKELYLYADMLYTLIEGINDPEYTKECIEKGRKIGLTTDTICKLIKKTNDHEYIKECIERGKALGLDSFSIHHLIQTINDQEYTKKCINRKEELGLNVFSVYKLIQGINKKEFFEECINRRKELGLDLYSIYELINLIGGIESIEGTEILNDVDLNKLKIIYSKDCLDNLLETKDRLYKRKINLPREMTFGIEIECIGKENKLLKENIDILFENWKEEWDLSLDSEYYGEDGVEFISPILTGSNEETTKEIRKVGIVLNEFEQYTNDTCGGHIHIGADYLTSVEAWQSFEDIILNTEPILYIIGNEKGSIPRKKIMKYASPISEDYKNVLNDGSINLTEEKDLKSFKEKIVKFQKDRERSINFYNLREGGKGTIEFRLPNGTVNPDTWVENINLFGGIVKVAEDLAKIQLKSEGGITKEEKEILDSFENIRNKEFDERAKLENLLKIVISEQDRDIYRERYNINSEMIKQRPDIEQRIKNAYLQEGVKISKNKIIKDVFNGDDSINMEEERLAEQIIDRDIEQQKESVGRGGI